MIQRNHPLYARWVGMKRRCFDSRHERYDAYGGRGITVAPEWLDFWTYVDDVGPIPCEINGRWTLDRIDNDGNYEPGNVRWALGSEQNKNRRSFAQPKKRKATCSLGHADWETRLGCERCARKRYSRNYEARNPNRRRAVSA